MEYENEIRGKLDAPLDTIGLSLQNSVPIDVHIDTFTKCTREMWAIQVVPGLVEQLLHLRMYVVYDKCLKLYFVLFTGPVMTKLCAIEKACVKKRSN